MYAVGHSAESVLTPLDADEIISDLSENEAGDQDSGSSVTVTAATATSASQMLCALILNVNPLLWCHADIP
jgi:hypothetical protein